MLPVVDIGPLFGPPSVARDAVDAAIKASAGDLGFMQVTGFPGIEQISPENRTRLKAIFDVSDAAKRRMMRVNFNPDSTNIYRGWYPAQPGIRSYKEGIDIGPDVASETLVSDDPLRELTPLPTDVEAPGWRAAAADYYGLMQSLGAALLRSIARGLGVAEDHFKALFENGISSFRLAYYPPRMPQSFGGQDQKLAVIQHHGETLYLSGAVHIDSGFITLLAQDGVPGLQVEVGGNWVDAPPRDDALVVNFGKLLQTWTNGTIRATRHRVVSRGEPRYSIPFFYEPAAEAVIRPLPGRGDFEAFSYGDFLWDATTKFVEQEAVRHLRPPRGVG